MFISDKIEYWILKSFYVDNILLMIYSGINENIKKLLEIIYMIRYLWGEVLNKKLFLFLKTINLKWWLPNLIYKLW